MSSGGHASSNRSGESPLADLRPGNPRLFDALVERAPVGVFLTDASGVVVYANERLCALSGLSAKQQLGHGWRAALHPDDLERVSELWERARSEGRGVAYEQRLLRPDGGVVWVEVSASPIGDAEGRVAGWAGVCVDVSERRLSERRHRELVEHARDCIYVATMDGRLADVNRAAEELTGYGRAELLEMSVFDLLVPGDADLARAALARSLAGEPRGRLELRLLAKDGRVVQVEASGRIVEEGGKPVRLEGIVRDVSERHALQEQLAHQAFHDPLTGLPNRVLFRDRLEHALSGAAREATGIAVALLDLDDFKVVNDSLGHHVGDHLLELIADRLTRTLRGSDTVARLGGDEFGFVVDVRADAGEVVAITERIESAFRAPFSIGDEVQQVSASMGIALARGGDDPDTILRNADTAMYEAKTTRRGGFRVFGEHMRRRVLRELQVRNALAEAIRSDALEVYYQPIVAMATGAVLAVEALARWPHPQWGWVQPSEFIPVAEASGLINALGRLVLGEAAKQLADWQSEYPGCLPLGVFVNVSPRELSNAGYATHVRKTLRTYDLPPTKLAIEITERDFLDGRDRRIAMNIAELEQAGVRLCLDDFGTGYSALASLKRFAFSTLKIDRFFVRAIRDSAGNEPIVSAVLGLGSALGLTVIAEGVEAEAQADYLARLGCDAAQGYHYARPQPARELGAHLRPTRQPLGTSSVQERMRQGRR